MKKTDLGTEIIQKNYQRQFNDPSISSNGGNMKSYERFGKNSEMQEMLKETIRRTRDCFHEWRRNCLNNSKLEEYKRQLDNISAFMNKSEQDLFLYFKLDLKINSDHHDDAIDEKLKEMIKHLRTEMSFAMKKHNFEDSYKKYLQSWHELKTINLDQDDNLIQFAKTRQAYQDHYEQLEKFRLWHNRICEIYRNFKESLGTASFAIPEATKMSKRVRELYDNIDQHCKEGADAVAANRYRLPITYEDLLRLKPNTWLNDRIINFFNEYLIEKIDKIKATNPLERIILYKSFFFSAITSGSVISMNNYNYSRIKNFTEKFTGEQCIFFNFARIGYIVNVNNTHWVFVVIDNQRQKIILYDSMRGQKDNDNENPIMKIFHQYIKDEVMDKQKLDTAAAEKFQANYKMEVGGCPRQQNGNDCGVHVCKNMHLFSNFEDINEKSYNFADVKEFRFKLFELAVNIGINQEGFLKFDELL
jgi:Ulp1 family protease